MTDRRINLDVPDIPDPKICAWLEANGIDPSDVPAAQEVIVKDGEISFSQFVRRGDMTRVLNLAGDAYVKEARTVPMLSAPENFGL